MAQLKYKQSKKLKILLVAIASIVLSIVIVVYVGTVHEDCGEDLLGSIPGIQSQT